MYRPTPHFLAAIAALLALATFSVLSYAAAPVCYGEEPCTAPKVSHYPGGMCVGWFQPGPLEWEPVGYCLAYKDIAPDLLGSIAGLWFARDKAEKDSLWNLQVNRQLTAVEQAAFLALFVERPPSLFAVKPIFSGSRPTYPIVNGERGTRSNGRIAVGEPCDGSVRFGDYMLVSENKVALCARR